MDPCADQLVLHLSLAAASLVLGTLFFIGGILSWKSAKRRQEFARQTRQEQGV